MEYLLKCECGRDHVVSRSQAGQEIQCSCGKNVSVPTLRGLAQLPAANPQVATTEGGPRTYSSQNTPAGGESRGGWQGWRGPALAIAAAGFLIATGFCGWFLLQRSQIDTSYTIETEIENGEKILDMSDPNELSQMWHTFGKIGLRTKQPPDFVLWNRYAEQRERFATTSAIVAGVFGLISLTIWYTAKRT